MTPFCCEEPADGTLQFSYCFFIGSKRLRTRVHKLFDSRRQEFFVGVEPPAPGFYESDSFAVLAEPVLYEYSCVFF